MKQFVGGFRSYLLLMNWFNHIQLKILWKTTWFRHEKLFYQSQNNVKITRRAWLADQRTIDKPPVSYEFLPPTKLMYSAVVLNVTGDSWLEFLPQREELSSKYWFRPCFFLFLLFYFRWFERIIQVSNVILVTS